MSKPKLQNKCKLCSLLHLNKDLWIDVHNKIIQEGMPKTKVCTWLNKKIEVLNASLAEGETPLPKFNAPNFTTHFTKHVATENQMKAELRAIALQPSPQANTGFTEDEQATAESVMDILGDSSYSGYPDKVAKLEKAIMDDLGGTNLSNQVASKAERQLRLLQTLISVKQKLSEVQRSEQVGGSAVRFAMNRLSDEVISSSTRMSIEIREILRPQLPGSSLPSDVELMIRTRVIDTLKGVYQDILDDVYKQYGIK